MKFVASTLILVLSLAGSILAEESAERGYRWLRTRTYLPPDFGEEIFDSLWKSWPAELRAKAKSATPAERREMTLAEYGMVAAPDEYSPGRALGYVDDGKSGWVMNCLACHGGQVAGRAIPGLPNSQFALQTLVEDVRRTKLFGGKKFAHLDSASLTMPLGTTVGTTNSVVFGVVLAALRDEDMNVDRSRKVPPLKHHDMDAPPLWNVKKKSMLYIDGFAPKNNRVLMQFMMLPRNSGLTMKSWEPEFNDILAWIESLDAPRYPWQIDNELAKQGKVVFEKHCSECHGTYGTEETYPEVVVPIDEIGTDRARLDSLNPQHRKWMKFGWMSRYGEDPVELNPKGYVAPPLDGVWATAPYFHNGSVPTLHDLLRPADQRPRFVRLGRLEFDPVKVGVKQPDLTGDSYPDYVDGEFILDTARPGNRNTGHAFGASANGNKTGVIGPEFTDQQRAAIIEFLKTL